MVAATFRFYEELNDFLAPARRGHEFGARCARAASAKHMIEALGVPHTEVELVLVNGESVGFGHALADGDRVAVYPKFEAFDITPLLRVRQWPLRETRFIADAHLGGLARLLRMTGFDTLYDNHFDDAEIERLARSQQRIVLSRDRDLLKRRSIDHGCCVRALRSERQLRELFERLDLARSARPFTRCLSCNGLLQAVDKADIAPLLPPRVRERHQRFSRCAGCARVFWEGTHWQQMRALIDTLPAAGRQANRTHEGHA
ncbi:MAG TPA: Mut7-C RNAse domain-containing protein [Rubrivivax sp.]|nr:Mut7-C RNAse domain-containing protein [Rubrivivax sp.]